MKRISVNTVLSLTLLFNCTAAFSNTFFSLPGSTESNWFVAIEAGEWYPNTFHSTIRINNGSGAPAPYDQDSYTTKKSHDPVLGMTFGRRFLFERRWLPAASLALEYQHLDATHVGNTIMQYSDPAFLNYSYKLDVSSDVVLAALKLNIVQWGEILPFIKGGIGTAFNHTTGYNENPLPGVTAPRVSPGFASYTTNQFAYVAGAGVDIQVAKQWMLSAEYQYQQLGNITSGKGTNTWSQDSLNLGSLHSNTVLFSLSYII